ncbi:hypothetical protein DFH08DRAFT_826275 [Mycena albidolilacea]|uniref:Uncharacterized protein n=1 Tax=Mycena albidolilacea TaxID=1033008 RepID=A0AAD6Z0K2_9AGAR|nr:hypothetical protein DFH08DRAFT_826275 [Mycena albidolilacea]
MATHGHWAISRREDSDLILAKRYDNEKMTWYPTDTGAHGENHEDANFVYANEEACEKQIKVTYNEKTAVATIVDLCDTCSESHIDLTIDLFKNLTGGDLDVDNGDGDDGGNETSTATTTHHTLISTPHTTSSSSTLANMSTKGTCTTSSAAVTATNDGDEEYESPDGILDGGEDNSGGSSESDDGNEDSAVAGRDNDENEEDGEDADRN